MKTTILLLVAVLSIRNTYAQDETFNSLTLTKAYDQLKFNVDGENYMFMSKPADGKSFALYNLSEGGWLTYWKTGTGDMVMSKGKLGIGISPSSELHIHGHENEVNSATADITLSQFNATNMISGLYTGTHKGGVAFSTENGQDAIGERMRIAADGDVGIGIKNPISKFHVYEYSSDTGSGGGITIEQDGGGDALLRYLLTGEQRWVTGIDNSEGDMFIIGRGAGWATGRDLNIDNSGNIGIGITPTAKLDIDGNAVVRGQLVTHGTDFVLGKNSGRDLGTKVNQRALVHFTQDRLYLNFDGDFEGGVVVQGPKTIFNGDIGVGTDSPSSELHIHGHENEVNSATADITLSQFNAVNLISGLYTGTHKGGISFSTENGENKIEERMRIAANGNVGIGTTDPDADALLTVAGPIHSKEIKVLMSAGDVPDYVFEENYNMMSLEETSNYILKNKHLPEIPSAQEIGENEGVNLGEMNMKLLQKIEELTLHLIDQNKQLETANQNIRALQEKVSSLEENQ